MYTLLGVSHIFLHINMQDISQIKEMTSGEKYLGNLKGEDTVEQFFSF